MHDKKCNSFEDIGKMNNENSNQLKDDEISIEN